MQKNFVTLFNSNYLSRGLAMYDSLIASTKDFHLYVVAFDDNTFQYLKSKNLPKLTPISLSEFEDNELLRIKPSRSAAEYCWTCTPSTVYYCINKFKLDHCVYIDADMFFYSDPQVLFDEWANESVLITEHRYTKDYDQSTLNGIYCVQFVGFKNDANGMATLKWWRDACIDWCYARPEDGKFGDQKYLDDWTTRFKGVHVLKHLGGGVAPWNIQQYTFEKKVNKIIGKELSSSKNFDLVFFHYHSLKFYTDGIVNLTHAYTIEMDKKKLLFFEYVKVLEIVKDKLAKEIPSVNVNGANEASPEKPLPIVTSALAKIFKKKEIEKANNFHYYYIKTILE
jgi:hypothetical protein